jgi:hypothetical protein
MRVTRGTEPHLLLILEHSVHDGRRAKDGQPLTISRRLQSVFLDRQGSAVAGGAAPYLDYRPALAEERASLNRVLNEDWLSDDIEARAVAFAVEHLVSRHLDEVRARRIAEIAEIQSEVEARLIQEINFWDARAEELALQEAAGRNQRLNAENARGIATTLAERLNRRRAELERERQIAAALPQLVGAALVVPSGMLQQPSNDAVQRPGLMERDEATEAKAMAAVMAAECAAGRRPVDVSAQKLGYDIESHDPKTRNLRFIEVKGRAVDAEVVIFTRNEMLTAFNAPDAYYVALVLIEAGFARAPIYVPRPHEVFGAEPAFAETARLIKISSLSERATAGA